MIGLASAIALGTGLALASPASAATTPPGDLTLPTLGGAELCDGSAQHQWIFTFTVDRGTPANTASIDIIGFNVQETAGGPQFDELARFGAGQEPIVSPDSNAVATVTGPATGGQLTATITYRALSAGGDDPAGEIMTETLGPIAYAACGPTSPTTSSTTSSTSSTTSTTAASTTSTTAGATTSTTAGATTTTVAGATTTTLGANDTTGTLTASPSTVAQGGSVTVSGSGFAPNASVSLTLFSDPVALGTLTANASGAISGSVTIPANAATGAHRIEAKGANNISGNNILSANIQVTSRGSSIARTGGPSDFLLPIGIAVVSFGILAFAWRERRLTQG